MTKAERINDNVIIKNKPSPNICNISEITGLSVSFISDLENGKPTAEIGKTIEVINLHGLDILVEARGDE